MAARLRVIVLNATADDADTFNVAFWADVPAARQVRYANAEAVSAWSGALQADNDALKSGAVVEKVMTIRTVKGTGIAARQAIMQQTWQDYQDAINALNPWQRYGSTWDASATWTVTNNG